MSAASVTARLEEDRPSFHVGGTQVWNALPETLSAIETIVSQGIRSIETGCGASTVVFASRHTVVLPFHPRCSGT